MKTAISLPDPLFDRAERARKRLGLSRSQLYARALATLLDTRSGDEITRALDRVYAEESSELDEVVAELQSRSLTREW